MSRALLEQLFTRVALCSYASSSSQLGKELSSYQLELLYQLYSLLYYQQSRKQLLLDIAAISSPTNTTLLLQLVASQLARPEYQLVQSTGRSGNGTQMLIHFTGPFWGGGGNDIFSRIRESRLGEKKCLSQVPAIQLSFQASRILSRVGLGKECCFFPESGKVVYFLEIQSRVADSHFRTFLQQYRVEQLSLLDYGDYAGVRSKSVAESLLYPSVVQCWPCPPAA